MSARYVRPVLCRLCGFPAPDGGVPVSQVDREKLSEWCWRMMDTELDQEGLEKAAICRFCISNARFEDKYGGMQKISSNWWRGLNENLQEEELYQTDLIKPCAVMIFAAPTQNTGSSNQIRRVKRAKIAMKCPYCSLTLPNKTSATRHVKKQHSDLVPFKCSLCNIFFKNKITKEEHYQKFHPQYVACIYCNDKSENVRMYKNLIFHVQYAHPGQGIRCKLCKNRFQTFYRNEEELAEHMRRNHPPPPVEVRDLVKCLYCPKMVENKGRKLNMHINHNHKAILIRCREKACATFFQSEQERREHQEQVHEKKPEMIQCPYCEKRFLGRDSQVQHINHNHPLEKIKCGFTGCFLYFHSLEENDAHFEQHHRAEYASLKFHCPSCDFRSNHMAIMREHTLVKHFSAKNHKCPKCSNGYATAGILKKHLKKVHTRVCCLHCNGFFGPGSMKQHLIRNKCRLCWRSFVCGGLSRKHRTTCNGNIECAICNRTFTEHKALRYHMTTQHGPGASKEAPSAATVKCGICIQSFASVKKLKRHEKGMIHLRNRAYAPFTCDLCQKQFPTFERIRGHMESTHEFRYKKRPCTDCGKLFKTATQLKSHRMRMHQQQTLVRCEICTEMFKENYIKFHRIYKHGVFKY